MADRRYERYTCEDVETKEIVNVVRASCDEPVRVVAMVQIRLSERSAD